MPDAGGARARRFHFLRLRLDRTRQQVLGRVPHLGSVFATDALREEAVLEA